MTVQTRIKILSGLSVFLCLSLILGLVLKTSSSRLGEPDILKDISASLKDYSSISIEGEGTSLKLEKASDSRWTLENEGEAYWAREDRVENLVRSLAALRVDSIASNKAESKESLGLDEKQGYVITLQSKAGARSLRFSPEQADSYITQDGSALSYELEQGLGEYLSTQKDYWIEKRLKLDFSLENISRISVQKPGKNKVDFLKNPDNESSDWTSMENSKLSAADAATVLRSFTGFDATEITLNPEFAENDLLFQLSLSDGKTEFSCKVYTLDDGSNKFLMIPDSDKNAKSPAGKILAYKVNGWEIAKGVIDTL